MERKALRSSFLRSVGHEGDTLHVEFQNGKVFAYTPVSAETYAAMLAAESAGKYFAAHVRPLGATEVRQTDEAKAR